MLQSVLENRKRLSLRIDIGTAGLWLYPFGWMLVFVSIKSRKRDLKIGSLASYCIGYAIRKGVHQCLASSVYISCEVYEYGFGMTDKLELVSCE